MPPFISFVSRIAAPTALAGLWLVPAAAGTWQDEIGFSELKARLGAAVPTGSGVAVTHVEAPATTAGGEYVPSATTAPTTGNFAGKEFTFLSGASAVSGHSSRVASFFYGLNTDPSVGDASVAPLAGTGPAGVVDMYEANGWLQNDLLRFDSAVANNSLLPKVESNAVSNHSWIGQIEPDFTADQANECLRRLDYSVERADYIAVVGLNNSAGTPVPPLLGSAYNVLSVGRTDGQHSTGSSPMAVDGGGRVKPELVAPMNATSWSTAVVSSCVALLMEKAATISPNAGRPEIVRSLLLAGARKDPFPSWSNSSSVPLDAHFGAGEVNVWRSYQVLAAGEFPASPTAPVAPTGWNYSASVTPGEARTYFFDVPAGCRAAEFSAALVWNRRLVTAISRRWSVPTIELANLDLFLHVADGNGIGAELTRSESGAGSSVAHSLEYIFRRDLPAGRYALRMTNAPIPDLTTDAGLSWLTLLTPASSPEISPAWTADGGALRLDLSHLGVGLTYVLQRSVDLASWTTVQTLVPTETTALAEVSADSARAFFRLAWAP